MSATSDDDGSLQPPSRLRRQLGTFDAVVQGVNQALAQEPPAYTVQVESVEDDSLEPIQFLAPGLLGWAVAMGATFSTAMPLVTWRTSKLLPRAASS